MNRFRGVVVPLLTPLTEGGAVDRAAMSRYIEFLVRGGVDAVFVLSSTGEFCAMPWTVQCEVVETALSAVGGRLAVCAGVSTQCLEESIQRARDMSAIGVDAVVALPPFYFRTSQEEMIEFFSRLADSSTRPLILYNMPFRTQHNIEVETALELREHGNIIGLKDSVSDAERTSLLAGELSGQTRFTYLHGNERLTLAAAAAGAHGCVPSIANLAPRFVCRAFRSAASGGAIEGDNQRMDGLMEAFGLFEKTPQQSTTLRLMALKAVMQSMGIMSARMVQLAPPLSEERLQKAREFALKRLADEWPETRNS
jgi:4-hydroxy-tetrahydrodipicolinate synthase